MGQDFDLGSAGWFFCWSRSDSIMGLYQWLLSQGSSASRLAGVVGAAGSHVQQTSSPRGGSRDPRGRKEPAPMHKHFSNLSWCPIYHHLISQNKSHDQAAASEWENRLLLFLGEAGISLQVPQCRSGVKGQTSLQMTTWTIYKLGICVRLCNTELLSIALTSFLEEFLETKST